MNRAYLSAWFWFAVMTVGAVWSIADIIGQCGGVHPGCTARPGLAPAALLLTGMLMTMLPIFLFGPRFGGGDSR